MCSLIVWWLVYETSLTGRKTMLKVLVPSGTSKGESVLDPFSSFKSHLCYLVHRLF